MSVLCANCGASLSWNYILEAKAKEDGHPVYCKTCAKLHRRGTEEDKRKLEERAKRLQEN